MTIVEAQLIHHVYLLQRHVQHAPQSETPSAKVLSPATLPKNTIASSDGFRFALPLPHFIGVHEPLPSDVYVG